MALLKNILIRFSAFFVLALLVTGANAQEDLSGPWDGKWIVDGTLFSLAVEVENEEGQLTQVEYPGVE